MLSNAASICVCGPNCCLVEENRTLCKHVCVGCFTLGP